MSDYGMTLPRATRRRPPQGSFAEYLPERPNKVIDHQGECCVICELNGVTTPLSRYNPNRDTCWTHTDPETDPLTDRYCPNCSEPSELVYSGECRACAQYRRKYARSRPANVIEAWRANHAAA